MRVYSDSKMKNGIVNFMGYDIEFAEGVTIRELPENIARTLATKPGYSLHESHARPIKLPSMVQTFRYPEKKEKTHIFKFVENDPGPIYVVIPTFNRIKSLRETLTSVIAQDPPPKAVVVVDDGSPKPTEVYELCNEMAKLSKTRIIHKRLPYNSGTPNIPRIEGMKELPEHCMVVEIDDHDWLCPGALRAMQLALRAGYSFVYGDAVRFKDGTVDYPPNWFTTQGTDNIIPVTLPRYDQGRIRRLSCEVTGARAYRKELYDEVGGWRPDECPGGDAALFLRFELATDDTGLIKIDHRLTWYRVTKDGISERLKKRQWENFVFYQKEARAKKPGSADFCFLDEPYEQDISGRSHNKISVVIANRNRIESLEYALRSLDKQNLWEIIVVDYGSDGKNATKIKELCDKHDAIYMPVESAVGSVWNKSKALNYGIIRTAPDAEIVACMDADMVVEPGFFAEVTKKFIASRGACLVVGRCYDVPQYDKIDFVAFRNVGKPRPDSSDGGMQALTRENWYLLHGYDERFERWGCEDNDLSERCEKFGLTRLWVEEPRFYHRAHPNHNDTSGRDNEYMNGSEARNRMLRKRCKDVRRNLITWGSPNRLTVYWSGPPVERQVMINLAGHLPGQHCYPITRNDDVTMDPWLFPPHADWVIGHGHFMRWLRNFRHILPDCSRINVIFCDTDWLTSYKYSENPPVSSKWKYEDGWVDGVVCNSRMIVDDLKKRGIIAEFSLHAFSSDYYTAVPQKSYQSDVVFAGNIWTDGDSHKFWKKVLTPAARAVKEVNGKMNIYGLKFVDSFRNAIKPYGANFCGYCTFEALPIIYASTKVICGLTQDSQQDCGMINNRTFEAMAAGKPLVIDWFKALDDEGISQYLWPVRNPEDAHEIVKMLLKDPNKGKEKAEEGKIWASKHATYGRIADVVLKVQSQIKEKNK